MIDLHSHSTSSDGQYTPTELIIKAHERGLSVLALTDHDSTSGLDEAEQKAKELNITFVRGIEISIEKPGCEFHLLGLGLKKESSSLSKVIQQAKQNRISRNQKMVEEFNKAGFSFTLNDICKDFPRENLGRPQFAQFLYSRGYVKNIQQAFDKFLARGKPCFIEKIGINLNDAVSAIYESGGVPVLAHPLSLYLSWKKLEDTLKELKNQGILGIEAFHPGARVVECEKIEKIAKKYGFFVTAGSDFHGEKIRHDRRLGITCGQRKIEDKFYYEELLPNIINRS